MMVRINTQIIISIINRNSKESNNNKPLAHPTTTPYPQPSARSHHYKNPTAIAYKVANLCHSDHRKYNYYTTWIHHLETKSLGTCC